MNAELQVLFYFALMSFILIFIQGAQIPLRFGFAWGLGNREEPKDPTPFMKRIARTIDNQIQALAIAGPVLVVLVAYPAAQSDLTASGAWTFLAGRVGFALCYLLGIPIIRSLFWGVGVIGWMIMCYGILISL